jgi:NAD(P)-dependent dehydrogenase (short-subunit alcohol dehydrogenase family)
MGSQPQRPTRSLTNRVAIVTGAGSKGDGIGNGRAAAILLAEAGANVVCVDMLSSDAERTVQMIQEDGHGKAIAVTGDVTVEAECQNIVERAIAEYGRLDILVNNVGVMGPKGTATDIDMDAWEKAMRINVSSMVMMVKYSVPYMERNDGQWRGAIVNIASVAGLRGGTPSLLYPTSKGAIVNMTRAMADHHAQQGIRVNCVCPGMLYTPMMYSGGMSEVQREARKSRSLLKTEGNGYDCGAAVRFLASDEAR